MIGELYSAARAAVISHQGMGRRWRVHKRSRCAAGYVSQCQSPLHISYAHQYQVQSCHQDGSPLSQQPEP